MLTCILNDRLIIILLFDEFLKLTFQKKKRINIHIQKTFLKNGFKMIGFITANKLIGAPCIYSASFRKNGHANEIC